MPTRSTEIDRLASCEPCDVWRIVPCSDHRKQARRAEDVAYCIQLDEQDAFIELRDVRARRAFRAIGLVENARL
jgi:hypothetical protein